MNYLELCQKVADVSGTVAGVSPFPSLTGATGRIAKIAGFVSDGWRNIQNERTDWLFHFAEFSNPLTIGKSQYDPSSDFSLELAEWLPDTECRRTMSLYDPAVGSADEGTIRQVSYDVWRSCWNFGAQTANRPVEWAISPNGKLCVGPAPDKAYVLRGQYRRSAQLLAADTDVPIIPEQFHGAIIGEALRLMIDSDEANEQLMPKMQRYEALRYPLVIAQTPPMYGF